MDISNEITNSLDGTKEVHMPSEKSPSASSAEATKALDDKIDELADLCQHWSRNRAKGVTPAAVKQAILAISAELVKSDRVELTSTTTDSFPQDFKDLMTRALSPTA